MYWTGAYYIVVWTVTGGLVVALDVTCGFYFGRVALLDIMFLKSLIVGIILSISILTVLSQEFFAQLLLDIKLDLFRF